MSSPNQALLRRRPGTSEEEFQQSYKRHGLLVLPWCVANNVVYYAQVHNPRWSSPRMASKHSDVNISDFDAAAEMVFQEGTSPEFEGPYWDGVILPDERRILFDEAIKHMQVVGPGTVDGTRVEFIVEGKPTATYDEWQRRWQECEQESKEKRTP